MALETGTTFDSVGWGAVFLDAENDGLLDLYVSGSLDGSVNSYLSSAFYHQQNDETFIIPQDIGFDSDNRESYSNAIGDINNDGKADIVVGNNVYPNFLWENQSINDNNWLKVKLEGVVSNRNGIGNTIEINIDGQSQYRYTLAGEGYLSQNSFYEFFGLANATEVDYVKVTWTTTGESEIINNIAVNQAIIIKEGSGILSSVNNLKDTKFAVYPNPSANGVFKILVANQEIVSLQVFDLSGRLITKKIDLINNDQINLSQYQKGIYIARFSSETKNEVLKLIID